MTQNPSSKSQVITDSLQGKVSEYEDVIRFCGENSEQEINYERLEAYLIEHNEWTEDAALELTHLVKQYGSFMLANALALAIACDVEDGELGF